MGASTAMEPRAPERPPGAGWRRRAGVTVAACAWLYLGLLLAAWALLRAADVWWPATLFMFSPRWLLTLPAALLLPAAAVLRRRSLGPLLAAVVLAFGPVTGFCIPCALPRGTPAGPRLRVLTYNAHHEGVDAAALERLLAETEPDVVAVQEWLSPDQGGVFARGGWHVHSAQDVFLASRFPIRQATTLGDYSMYPNGLVERYELETPAGVVTLFSLHLATVRFGVRSAARDLWAAPAEIRAVSALRRRQSEKVAREAAAVRGPVLLAGDFNTPPESALFRDVWAGFPDAFSQAGWGWGYTFLNRRTAVRIDHVLAGPGWECVRCRVGPDLGSPHRPVLADLVRTAD